MGAADRRSSRAATAAPDPPTAPLRRLLREYFSAALMALPNLDTRTAISVLTTCPPHPAPR
ncbi:MAG TPA: hypothetical protein VF734_15160 [Pseudonocardiaceae bacterium]